MSTRTGRWICEGVLLSLAFVAAFVDTVRGGSSLTIVFVILVAILVIEGFVLFTDGRKPWT